jgi:hypothetical protein
MSDEHSLSLCHASAKYGELAGKLRELASFPEPGPAYCSSRDRSIAAPVTSTAGPYERALCDRRDAGMDAVRAGRAPDRVDVFAGA